MAVNIERGYYRYTLNSSDYSMRAVCIIDVPEPGDLEEYIEYGGKTYTLKSLSYCFSRKKAMIKSPRIPNSVTAMDGCFYECSSLNVISNIPNNVTTLERCFYNCLGLTTPPDLSNCNNLENMSGCFYGCNYLVSPPEIPITVNNLTYCFYGCWTLSRLPSLNMDYFNANNLNKCFYGCDYTNGELVVRCELRGVSDITTAMLDSFPDGITKVYIISSQPDVGGDALASWMSYAQKQEAYNPVISLEFPDTEQGFSSGVTIGDYKYTPVDSTESRMDCNVVAIDKSKTAYENIKTQFFVNTIFFVVTDMSGTFSNCANMLTSPQIPSTARIMDDCYSNCKSLTSFPENFDNLTSTNINSMVGMFSGCESLYGNTLFSFNKTTGNPYRNIFSGTKKDIYVFNGLQALAIAEEYANVHYIAQDNPIPDLKVISLERVDVNKNPSVSGEYLDLTIEYTFYDTFLPYEWYFRDEFVSPDTVVLKIDNITTSATVTHDYTNKRINFFINLTNLSKHDINVKLTKYLYYDGHTTGYYRECYINTLIPSSMPLVSYRSGGGGIAFGKNAEADIFDVDLDAVFRRNSYIKLDHNGTRTSKATSGTDMNLFNALYDLDWWNCLEDE